MPWGNPVTHRGATTTWRWFQSFLLSVLIALAIWIGRTVQESQIQIATLQAQVAELSRDTAGVGDLRTQVAAMQMQLNDNSRRLDHIEDGGAKVKGWTR